MSADLSASLDPRQVADLIASHMARAMGVDECAISYWDRPGEPDRVARLLPGDCRPSELEPFFDVVPLSRRRCASSSGRRRSSSTPTIPTPIRPRSP